MSDKYELTLFSLLISLIGSFIHKYSNHNDICIGTVNSGRTHEELSSCIGMFVQTLPLRFSIDKNDTFEEICDNLNEKLLETYQFADFPIWEFYTKQSQPFDVLIAYQNPDFSLKDISEFQDVNIRPIETKHQVSRFPLTFNFYHYKDNLYCDLEYSTDYSQFNISIIARKFQKYIKELISNPNLKIFEYDISLEEEVQLKQDIQIDFNF